MQEIIIPDDGLLYKTSDGTPILQISVVNDATIFSLFSKYGNSRLTLLCHESESGIHIGNAQKSIAFIASETKNEMKFTNENGKVTHLFHTTDSGGQVELCDDNENPIISLGVNSDSTGSFFIRNKNGDFLVALLQNNETGSIEIRDNDGTLVWSSYGG